MAGHQKLGKSIASEKLPRSCNLVVIGIPSWKWKAQLLAYAKKHPNLIEITSGDLCHECSRHRELLSLFDQNRKDFEKTEYFLYQKKNGKNRRSILQKIARFAKLYIDIQENGCRVPPVITDDGCRLDGSHRCAILMHLQQGPIVVNLVKYEDVYSSKNAQQFRLATAKYRKRVYGL